MSKTTTPSTTTTLASTQLRVLALLTASASCVCACQHAARAPGQGTPTAQAAGDAGDAGATIAYGDAGAKPQSLGHEAIAVSPGFIVHTEERHVSPSTWTWEVPKDGCFRVFLRADAHAEVTMDAFKAGVDASVLSAPKGSLRSLPADGPRCDTKGAKWTFGLKGASPVSVEIAIVGSP